MFLNTLTDQVHKLHEFDIPMMKTIDGKENPNVLDGLPDIYFRSLSKDRRYYEITYAFINGNHEPETLKQFVGVVKILDCLHTHIMCMVMSVFRTLFFTSPAPS